MDVILDAIKWGFWYISCFASSWTIFLTFISYISFTSEQHFNCSLFLKTCLIKIHLLIQTSRPLQVQWSSAIKYIKNPLNNYPPSLSSCKKPWAKLRHQTMGKFPQSKYPLINIIPFDPSNCFPFIHM